MASRCLGECGCSCRCRRGLDEGEELIRWHGLAVEEALVQVALLLAEESQLLGPLDTFCYYSEVEAVRQGYDRHGYGGVIFGGEVGDERTVYLDYVYRERAEVL